MSLPPFPVEENDGHEVPSDIALTTMRFSQLALGTLGVGLALMTPCEGADVDFSTQSFPIMVPPESDGIWEQMNTIVVGTAAQAAFSQVNTTIGSLATLLWQRLHPPAKPAPKASVLIGHVLCSRTVVVEDGEQKLRGFSVRRCSLNYALRPEVGGVAAMKDKMKSFCVALNIKAAHANSLEIKDILPSTAFFDASVSGKITVASRIGIAKSGHFATADGDASLGADGSFSWVYQPKEISVASGVAGNEAFIDFLPKKAGEFYVGQVPIELSLLVPNDLQEAEITLITSVTSANGVIVPAGEGKIRVLFQ
jgi:hypothetical protein